MHCCLTAHSQSVVQHAWLQDTANLMWGLAKLGHAPGPNVLNSCLAQLSASNVALRRYKAMDLASILWSLAVMGRRPEPKLIHSMVSEALAKSQGMNMQVGGLSGLALREVVGSMQQAYLDITGNAWHS